MIELEAQPGARPPPLQGMPKYIVYEGYLLTQLENK